MLTNSTSIVDSSEEQLSFNINELEKLRIYSNSNLGNETSNNVNDNNEFRHQENKQKLAILRAQLKKEESKIKME